MGIQATVTYGDMQVEIITDADYSPDIADDLVTRARQQIVTMTAQLTDNGDDSDG